MDPEDFKSSQIYDHFLTLQSSNHPYQVPPDETLLESFESATSAGFVQDPFKGREPFSLLFKDNHPFEVTTSSDLFSQMGVGYTLFFIFGKFTIWLSLFPLAIYALCLMIMFSLGDSCVSSEQLDRIASQVNSLNDLPKLQSLYPQTPVPTAMYNILNQTTSFNNFTMYEYLNCLVINQNDKCNNLSALNCKAGSNDTKCKKAELEVYLQTYVTGICEDSLISSISAGNFVNSTDQQHYVLYTAQVISVFLFMIVISIFYYYHEKKVRTFMRHNAKIERFSAVLCGLGDARSPDLSSKIKDLFQNHALKISSVNFLYDTKEFLNLQRRLNQSKRDLAKKAFMEGREMPRTLELEVQRGMKEKQMEEQDAVFRSLMDNSALSYGGPVNSAGYDQDQQTREGVEIEKAINEFRQVYLQGPSLNSYFLGSAVISFETQEEQVKAMSIFERRGWLYNIFGFGPIHTKVNLILKEGLFSHQLWLEKAYAPSDILWENLGYSKLNIFIRGTLSFLFATSIIVLVFFAVLTIKVFGLIISNNLNKRSSGSIYYEYLANIMVSGIITIIDYIIQWVFGYLGKHEKVTTISDNKRNLTRKIWKMQFVASGIIPAAVAVILMNWYGNGGMTFTIHFIFIFQLLLTPFSICWLDPVLWWKWYTQSRVRKFIATRVSGKVCTQEEANEIFLKDDFNLPFCYSLMLKNTALACFFATIFPLGIVYLAFQMFVYYWCFKYMLVHLSNKTKSFSDRISRDLIEDLEICVEMFVLGMIYEELVRRFIRIDGLYFNLIHVALLVIVVIYYEFNLKRFSTDFLREASLTNSTFYQLKVNDPNSYYLSNPASIKTMRSGNKQPGSIFNQVTIHMLPNKDFKEISYWKSMHPEEHEEENKIYVSKLKDSVL